MPYTFEEFRQHYTTAFLKTLTPEENAMFLNSLTPEERLRGLPAAQAVKQVVKQFSPKEILTELGLPSDVMAKILPTLNKNKKG